MKFKFLKQLVLSCALIVSANATAGIISSTDTHVTSDGSVVDLSGLDWLTWDVTLGQSRTSVENGYGGLVQAGWRYATVNEYQTFMQSVFDVHSGWSTDNQDGAQWIYDNIYGLKETSRAAGSNFASFFNLFGEAVACGGITVTCRGHYRLYSRNWSSGNTTYGYSTTRDNTGWYPGVSVTIAIEEQSSMMVRAPIQAPEPTTLAIFALGMMGLASRRFKKQS